MGQNRQKHSDLWDRIDRNTATYLWDRIDSSERNPHGHHQLIYNKGRRGGNGLFNKCPEKLDSYIQKNLKKGKEKRNCTTIIHHTQK